MEEEGADYAGHVERGTADDDALGQADSHYLLSQRLLPGKVENEQGDKRNLNYEGPHALEDDILNLLRALRSQQRQEASAVDVVLHLYLEHCLVALDLEEDSLLLLRVVNLNQDLQLVLSDDVLKCQQDGALALILKLFQISPRNQLLL
jgi:hypothetical protein